MARYVQKAELVAYVEDAEAVFPPYIVNDLV